jgi:tetratricopeptide (TPR) repeat protein
MLELRTAAQRDIHSALAAACALAAAGLGDRALAAAPSGKQRRLYLEQAARCFPVEQPTTLPIDEALLREFPDSALGREKHAWRLFSLGKVDESLAQFAELLVRHPDCSQARIARARILAATSRFDGVIEETKRGVPLTPNELERAQLFGLQAEAYAHIGQAELAEHSVLEVRRLAATGVDALAASYALAGRVQLYLQHPGQAFAAYREAFRINQDTQYLIAVASLATQLGDRPQALWAYINLCQRDPTSRSACTRRDELSRPAEPDFQ